MYHTGGNDLQLVIFGSGIALQIAIRSPSLCSDVALPLDTGYEFKVRYR